MVRTRVPVRFVLVYQGQRVPLREGDTVIGRSMSCQVRFNAPTVSRQHVVLHVRGESITAENLSTTTGTLHNGKRMMAKFPVVAGDTLTLGPRIVSVERWDPDSGAMLTPIPQPALGMLPDGDDDEITQTEMVAHDASPITFHTCPKCRTAVEFVRSTCPICGHAWPKDGPSHRLGEVTSRNVADEVVMPAQVMAVYSSEVMTLDITLSDLRRDGAFIPTELLDAPHTPCELTLLPDGASPLHIKGKVASARAASDGQALAGMDVKFTEMSDGVRLWLDLWWRQYKKR